MGGRSGATFAVDVSSLIPAGALFDISRFKTVVCRCFNVM